MPNTMLILCHIIFCHPSSKICKTNNEVKSKSEARMLSEKKEEKGFRHNCDHCLRAKPKLEKESI